MQNRTVIYGNARFGQRPGLLNILHQVNEAGAVFRSIVEPMLDTTSQLAEAVIAVLATCSSPEIRGYPRQPIQVAQIQSCRKA
jgi:hypothetical protein